MAWFPLKAPNALTYGSDFRVSHNRFAPLVAKVCSHVNWAPQFHHILHRVAAFDRGESSFGSCANNIVEGPGSGHFFLTRKFFDFTDQKLEISRKEKDTASVAPAYTFQDASDEVQWRKVWSLTKRVSLRKTCASIVYRRQLWRDAKWNFAPTPPRVCLPDPLYELNAPTCKDTKCIWHQTGRTTSGRLVRTDFAIDLARQRKIWDRPKGTIEKRWCFSLFFVCTAIWYWSNCDNDGEWLGITSNWRHQKDVSHL